MRDLTERHQFYKRHLDTIDEQGVTISKYARTHGLKPSALYDARKRLRQRSSFVRVVADGPARAGTPLPVQIRLPNGITVSIGSDPATLPALLRAVAAL